MANEEKKDFNAMLNDSKDMPKFQIITDEKSIKKYGGDRMYFAPPIGRQPPVERMGAYDQQKFRLAQVGEDLLRCGEISREKGLIAMEEAVGEPKSSHLDTAAGLTHSSAATCSWVNLFAIRRE